MRILFIMKYPLVDQYAIMQKLNGEINAVKNLGHEVYYISFDRDYLYLDNGTNREIIQKTTLGKTKHYFHTVVFYDIYNSARKIIANHGFDVVYFRHSPLNFLGYRMVKAASEKSKLVVEISSFPPYTEKAKNIIRAIYHKFSRKWWERAAQFVTLFTGIGEYAETYLNTPFLNIDNGIDVSLVPVRKIDVPKDANIHLLAVASMCEWHGYERIIKGLSQWNSYEAGRYIFDLVGDEGDGSITKWKKLADELDLTNQVVFHGRMTGDTLTEMYNNATIGICSLAMYKIGFNKGSVLKLREYMARGLPFVYAHEDPHMKEWMPWCLQIPNDNTAVPMDEIDQFVKRIITDRTLPVRMREYAKENMTWESQFEKIFKKLEEIK